MCAWKGMNREMLSTPLGFGQTSASSRAQPAHMGAALNSRRTGLAVALACFSAASTSFNHGISAIVNLLDDASDSTRPSLRRHGAAPAPDERQLVPAEYRQPEGILPRQWHGW